MESDLTTGYMIIFGILNSVEYQNVVQNYEHDINNITFIVTFTILHHIAYATVGYMQIQQVISNLTAC